MDHITEFNVFVERSPEFVPSISQALAEGHSWWRAKSCRYFRPWHLPVTMGNGQEEGTFVATAHSSLGVGSSKGDLQPLIQMPKTYPNRSLFPVSFRVSLPQKQKQKLSSSLLSAPPDAVSIQLTL